jgi:hypothetical protein
VKRLPFLAAVGLIILAGTLIFGAMTAFLAWGRAGTTPAASGTTSTATLNAVGSYGATGLTGLAIKPTANTPSFISNALKQQKGVILLAYVSGATDDDEMLASFNAVKAEYSSQAAFFSFESADVSELGDVLEQLRVSAPPILAVIRGDGSVYQLYTGWISQQVMDQVVANAISQ